MMCGWKLNIKGLKEDFGWIWKIHYIERIDIYFHLINAVNNKFLINIKNTQK